MATATASTIAVHAVLSELSDKGLLRGSIGLAVLSIAGFGFLYSLVGVGLGQAAFPAAANGSASRL